MECASTQAFIASPSDAVAFQWYLDGVSLAGATAALYEMDGEGMALGWHTLAVKVTKSDGSVSSATEAVYLNPVVGRGGWVELTFTNKDDPADVWYFLLPSGPAEDSGFTAILVFLALVFSSWYLMSSSRACMMLVYTLISLSPAFADLFQG